MSENKPLSERLRNGFGTAAGRAKQVEAYRELCNEAADEIAALERQRDALLEALKLIKLGTYDEWIREKCSEAIATVEGWE